MIKFPCKCGYPFSVTDDMGSGLVQCPRCGLLADVPSLNDIVNLTDEGIFKLGDVPDASDDIGVAELHEAFTRQTVDEHGREIDLRGDEEHYEKIGVPRQVDALGLAPKYDPVTGELIRVIEVINDEPMPVIPIATVAVASPSLAYATGHTRGGVTPAKILLDLFMPGNIVVLGFVLAFFILAVFFHSILVIESGFFNVSLQVLNIPLWLILSHYGNVIEDMGPDAQDELPRPLRHLDITEDIWNPLLCVLMAFFICYLPAMALGSPRVHLGHGTAPLVLLLGLIGTFFFPAVVLTSVTGTTVLNLRPDRVVGVIRQCGLNYVVSVLTFVLAVVPTEFYLVGRSILPDMVADLIPSQVNAMVIQIPVLAIAVYFGHFFCWHLGLMYRANHAEFPWVFQRHIRKPRDPSVAPPRRGRNTV